MEPGSDDMLCVVLDPKSRTRVATKMHWGLIPRWAKEPKLKFPTFNARANTLAEKATFRDAWKKGRRCLIVTDGFSCREQIAQGTHRRALHVAEVLAD